MGVIYRIRTLDHKETVDKRPQKKPPLAQPHKSQWGRASASEEKSLALTKALAISMPTKQPENKEEPVLPITSKIQVVMNSILFIMTEEFLVCFFL